jgi:peptidoglycan/xylan/chitin deacetylase (PgdA/CDA1 family)
VEPYIEDKKLVALTFDDGPLSPYTEQYLDILSQHGAKATFFCLGDSVQANPELARRIAEEGHQVCNHTMAHNQLTAVDNDVVYSEITRSAAVIEEATGVHTTHIRPPYGDFTERSWLGSRGSITASIRWTGDSMDWSLPGVDAIVSNSLLNLHSGSIILMHDGGGDRSQDVEALSKIVEQLQSEGYELVTISDLMRAMGTIPEDICSGTGTMPKDAVWPDEISPEDIAAANAG